MHAVDDQQRRERACDANKRPRRHPHGDKGNDHRGLRKRIERGVVTRQPIGDFAQKPGQRRQLIVAELPLAAVGHRLDHIERQVVVEKCGQGGPYKRVDREERGQDRARPMFY